LLQGIQVSLHGRLMHGRDGSIQSRSCFGLMQPAL